MGDARILRGAAVCECGDHGFVGLTQGLVAFVDAELFGPSMWQVATGKSWGSRP
jgi:hypothetical protein